MELQGLWVQGEQGTEDTIAVASVLCFSNPVDVSILAKNYRGFLFLDDNYNRRVYFIN